MSRDWKIKLNPLREGDAIPAFTIFGFLAHTINVFFSIFAQNTKTMTSTIATLEQALQI
jgi:hypothetical protein